MMKLGGRDPTDPPAAGMRQLTYIAGTYASASAGAASVGADTPTLAVMAATGLAHAAIANWHGIKRGEQNAEIRKAEVRAEVGFRKSNATPELSRPAPEEPRPGTGIPNDATRPSEDT
jgi:hypothetical protein